MSIKQKIEVNIAKWPARDMTITEHKKKQAKNET